MILLKNFKESAIAVGSLAVLCLSLMLFGIVPFSQDVVIAFLIGCALLIIGQSLFLMGAETSLVDMGKKAGANLNKLKNFFNILIFGFVFGFATTVAEPDVSLFISNLVGIEVNSFVFFFVFGLGVGAFVVLGLVKLIKGIPLKWVLLVGYGLILIVSIFSPNYLGIAFDSGGVTTGTITTPFLMALAIGLSAMRVKSKTSDSFGMLAIATIGSVLFVAILGIFLGDVGGSAAEESSDIVTILLTNMKNVIIVLAPIIILFFILNFMIIKAKKYEILKICIGLVVAYVGLVLFLTGASYGVQKMANYIGSSFMLLSGINQVLTVLIFGACLGFVLVFTEPAINIFAKQVADVSSGFLSRKRVLITMGIGISAAVVIALVRALTGLSLWYFLVPLVAIAVGLAFCIPDLFVGVAFDGGGIASGTMSVVFVLPLASGLSASVLGGYGVISIISIVPIITVEVLALIYKINERKNQLTERKNSRLFYKALIYRNLSLKKAKDSARAFQKQELKENKILGIKAESNRKNSAKTSAKVIAKTLSKLEKGNRKKRLPDNTQEENQKSEGKTKGYKTKNSEVNV